MAILVTLWAVAALYFDFPISWLRLPLSIAYLTFLTGTLWRTKASCKGILLWIGSLVAITIWWLTLAPSNNRNWQPDVAQMPWAEIHGDFATIHNIRNCDYVTEMNYTPHWETKTVDLSQIRGVDLFITYWGMPWIAHAIVSFQFADGTYLATSIEARKEAGESYSAIRGFFRQFELIYLIAEERDVVRVRTNYRKGEFVYLYRTMTKPEDARNLFREYLHWMNQIRERPQWYNALTSNCVSSVIAYLAKAKIGGLSRWDIRTLFNGYGDKMLYDLGNLRGDLPFTELKRRALINEAAQKADKDPDFSRRIREGRPGFEHRE